MVISNFDFQKLHEPFNMAIIGKTGSGKTTLLKHILLQLKFAYDFIYIFIRTEQGYCSNNYHRFIYPNHAFFLDDFKNKEDMNNKINNIKNYANKINKNKQKYKTLIIFDDVGSNTRNKLSNFTNESRHSYISTIFLIHNPVQLDPETRTSMHYFVINNKNENFESFIQNKTSRLTIQTEVTKIFSDYDEKGLFVIIDNMDNLYNICISDTDLNNINNIKPKIIMPTLSSIKDKIKENKR